MSNRGDIVNHIAIVLDRSGSMLGLTDAVIKQYNRQAQDVSQQAEQTGQKTLLSLYTFSDAADQPILVEAPLDLVDLRPLTRKTYAPAGGTAMLDSIGLTVEQLSQFERGRNDSFLVIVITDGEENQSIRHHWDSISRLVKTKIATDAWTFVFLVPKGMKSRLLSRLDVYDGNVREWDQSDRGVEDFAKATQAGIGAFFTGRAAGRRSTKGFFTDLSSVSEREVKSLLIEVTGKFKKGAVKSRDVTGTDQHGNSTVVIQEFCEKTFKQPYVVGKAYYELMKREKLQSHKQLVIEERDTGKMYGGDADAARNLLNLPSGGEISVAPGDHGKFRIFVQSTSVNRKLVEGEEVLYER